MTGQIDFAVAMHTRYLKEKDKSAVGIRRLHYFVVSLPQAERMMPGKNGSRLYENTLTGYQRLSGLLVEARIRGMIPWDSIIDEKNLPPVFMPDREEAYSLCIIGADRFTPIEPISNTMPMLSFEDFAASVKLDGRVSGPHFTNQGHRIVVAIEKGTSQDRLTALCERYGADLLIFSGQFSLTRVNDVVERARGEDLPVALLYISDLDCAGWFMPEAFFNRINEIYPHPDHVVVRVALTRGQAAANNLPPAFDPDDKGYKPGQIARFIKESGGNTCIELDALDEKYLLTALERHLEKYANLTADREEHEDEVCSLQETISAVDMKCVLEPLHQQYEQVRGDHNQALQELGEREKRINELVEKEKNLRWSLVNLISHTLRDEGIDAHEAADFEEVVR